MLPSKRWVVYSQSISQRNFPYMNFLESNLLISLQSMNQNEIYLTLACLHFASLVKDRYN